MFDERRNMVERFGLKNVPMVYGSIDPFNPTVWPAGPLGQRLGLRPRGPFDTTNQYVEPIVDQEEMIEITETDEDGIGMQVILISSIMLCFRNSDIILRCYVIEFMYLT